MTLFWYTDSKEAKGMKSGTMEEWEKVKLEWQKNHPFLHIINEIYDFFYYPINRFYDFVIDIPKKIRAYFQRANRGWSNRDTWHFSFYLAEVIRDGVKFLKEHKHGVPCGLTTEKISFEKSEEKWNEILDEIIWSFDMYSKCIDGGYEFYFPHRKSSTQSRRKFLKWKKEHEKKFNMKFMTKEENSRMRKGMQLFIKYFDSLWD